MAELVNIDGVDLAVEHRTQNGHSVGGRSLLAGGLQPAWQGESSPSGIEGVVNEMGRAGWPSTTVADAMKWLHMPIDELATAARTQPPDDVNDDHRSVKVGDELLSPPWPLDLVHVPPAQGEARFEGPLAARLWLRSLDPTPGDWVSKAYDMNVVGYMNSNDHSGMMKANVKALVSAKALRAVVRFESPQPEFPRPMIHYLVPLASVSQITVDMTWGRIRPLFGEGRKVYDSRGFGLLNKMVLIMRFSDGWRDCRLVLGTGGLLGMSRFEESNTLEFLQGLLTTIGRTQGENDSMVREIPMPVPANEAPKGLGLEDSEELTTVFDFDSSIRFGIRISPEQVEPPRVTTTVENLPSLFGVDEPGSQAPIDDAPLTHQPPPPRSADQPPPPLKTTGMPQTGTATTANPTLPTIVRTNVNNTAIEMPQLGFGCSNKDMPIPLSGTADAFYIGGVGSLTCDVPILDHETGEELPEPGLEIGQMEAMFSAALFQGSMAIIVHPMREKGPNYWIRVPLDSAEVISSGQVGTFKKRPVVIGVVIGEAFGIGCVEVSRFWPNTERLEARQTGDMLTQLLAQ